jgi:uncharacterized lipoprotein YehR (DUF1307 family)
MKNTIRLLGIIVFVAIIGFSFVACDDGGNKGGGTDPINGTWVNTQQGLKIVAANGSFKEYDVSDNKEIMRGTYTYSGTNATATITEVNTVMFDGVDTWVTWADLDSEYKGYIGGEQNMQMTVSNNTLIITELELTFTKQ